MGVLAAGRWLQVEVEGQGAGTIEGKLQRASKHSPDFPHRKEGDAKSDKAISKATFRKLQLARVEAILTDGEMEVAVRLTELLAVLSELAPEDFPAMAEVVQKFQGGECRMEIAVINRWAEFDPEAALAFSLPHRNGTDALEAWAERDMEAAVEWMTRNREAEGLHRVFRKLARTDPERVSELANAWPDVGWQYEACLGMVPMAFERGGLRGFREWISGIENAQVRRLVMEKVAGASLIQEDPAGMLEWLEMEPPETSDDLRDWFLKCVGKKDPAMAIGYFDRLPAERRTPEAFESVIEGIGGFDPPAAVELMARHPDLSGEGCGRKFIRSAMLEEPEVVLAWVDSQAAEPLRLLLRREALGFWRANRTEIPRRWIETYGPEGEW